MHLTGTSVRNFTKRPLISVLDKMIAQDVLKTLFSVWLVLVVILVSQKFIKILEKAVEGHISNDTILTILGLKTVAVSIFLLPAATFMALLMVLGRLYKEQEMSAIAGAGGGAGILYKALFLVIFPLTVASYGLSLYVAPWAEARMQSLVNQDEQASDVRGIAEGKFSEYSAGNLVFYVEKISPDNQMHSVFVQDRQKKDQLSIILSERSHFTEMPGGRYIVFEEGQHVRGKPGDFDYVIEGFKEYGIKMEERALSTFMPTRAEPSSKLSRSKEPKDIAEYQNRLIVPVTILLFTMISVPLARVSPRGGIYGSIFLGFLIYICQGNFSGVVQSWVVKGSISPWPGIFWVSFAMFWVALLLLAKWHGFRWIMQIIKKRVPS